MKLLWIGLLGMMVHAGMEAQAQKKSVYALPSSISPDDYDAGRVLVKIKEKYKDIFRATGPSARVASILPGVSANAFSHNRKASTAGRMAPRKPVIDISQYFELRFDPSRPVEEVIHELYATGYVELAEPAYKMKMQFVPNDPALASQYYLTKIRATQAWDISQGSSDIVIGIVDSGVDIDHPDLASQLYINTADPINGIDDDQNGYIDDYRGWDFSGADTLNAFNPNFIGDNDPSIPKAGGGFSHGTQVGGCAGGAVNNSIGIAGVGYNTKLMFTKHFADNQPSSDVNYSSNLYLGVLYAAENGARIINCSWGSSFRSQVYQDIITYVTFDLGCLVIAAAGNDNTSTPLYPAAYNHVLSVAATSSTDKKANFSNFGSTVDIAAPGVDIFTTTFNNDYASPDGTSFSAPITAGAAALVWAHFPSFTPMQVAEQLRVTADESFYTQNPSFQKQLGKGRLDIYKALTATSPAIRALDYRLLNSNGNVAEPGDMAFLTMDFINYLESTSAGLEISISTTSTAIAITKNKINPGTISAGATLSNTLTPFELTLNSSIPENSIVDLVITYSDGVYQDYQVFSLIPNPSYRDVDENRVITTITSAGRLGYEDSGDNTRGSGFIYNDASILFEMGLIMGSSSASILNTVRNGTGGFDQDFVTTQRIREVTPGERSYSEIFGEFSNSTNAANQKVKVEYRSLVWRDAPRDKFVVLEYTIKNPQATLLTNFYFGIFSDWDISFNGGEDAAQWNAGLQLGYVFPKQSTSLPHAGIQLLTENPNYFAIDNSESIAGNPFGIYDGYTDAEKFTSISTQRLEAGNSTASGNDVSHVVSSGPHTLAPGEEITIAFALHAADNLNDLLNSARYADSVYNFTLTAPKPEVDTVDTCYGSDALITATGATEFKWYREFTGGVPLASGPTLNVSNVLRDTTLFVSNADESFESVRTPAHVRPRSKPEILTSRSATLCEGDVVILSVEEATEYLWSTGESTQSIEVSAAGEYSVVVKYMDGVLNCESNSEVVTVTNLERPTSQFTYQENTDANTIDFTDTSTGATSWFWNFDDGTTSIEPNPSHTYSDGGNFNVTLTVTGANGCQDNSDATLFIVLSAESLLDKAVQVFPVPATRDNLTVLIDGIPAKQVHMSIIDAHGKSMTDKKFDAPASSFRETIDIRNYRTGIYFLKLYIDNTLVVKKILVY